MPENEISEGRRATYYVGLVLTGLGLVLFLSVFLTGILNFGDFSNFDQQARSSGIRAILGIVLMAAGGGLQRMGSLGLAGSGVVLDPKQAREDVKPWSRMAGGVVEDALSEVDLAKHLGGALGDDQARRTDGETEREMGGRGATVVKVRCRSCQALNDEDARYCKQCGKAV